MHYDFNVLERRAKELIDAGRSRDAIRIYLFMADGDPSLDAGYLGWKLGECYERLGELQAAKYWYGRALEEGREAWPAAATARQNLAQVSIDDLVSPDLYVVE
jgi:tetratricopeptide (TPR) repeat protein